MRTSAADWGGVPLRFMCFLCVLEFVAYRYWGYACRKQDWAAGGHKDKCGLFTLREDEDKAVQ